MKKKILVLIILLVIIAAAVGGWFWWTNLRTIKGSAVDYIIKQVENGEKIVENEKAGMTFTVPEGWVEEKIEGLEGSVIIYSPDTEFIKPRTVPLKAGCLIGVGIRYKKMSFEELKEEINDIHFGLGVKSEEFEEITVQNYPALKNTFDTAFMGKGTVIYIPRGNKLYDFPTYAAPEDEEQCLQDFTEFVNNVSIK